MHCAKDCWLASCSKFSCCVQLPSVHVMATCQVCYHVLQLVDEAYQRWLVEEEGVVDDITAVVVKFIHTDA